MIGLFVLVVMVWNFYIGYRRGLFMQGYYTLAMILALVIAANTFRPLADAINLWIPYANPARDASVAFFTDQNIFSLDRVYYAGVAFFAIYLVAYYILRFVGVFLHFFKIEGLDAPRFQIIGGILAVLVCLVPFTLVGNILATIPMEAVQNTLSSSWVARFLINSYFPFSHIIQGLWVSMI